MAEASSVARAKPLHGGLPDEIVLWEILVRLPPKSLLRCRAVCRAWRRATSARDFLLAHHGRQPSLPVICGYEYARDFLLAHHGQQLSLPVICGYEYARRQYSRFLTLDNRAVDDAQLQHVDELDDHFYLVASCDGLFILFKNNRQYYVRNPATRQSARLLEIDGFLVLGMYQHGPTGEYRLLLYWEQELGYKNPTFSGHDGPFIFALGSGQPPRRIGCLEAREVRFHRAGLLFRGSLHWHLAETNMYNSESNMLMVFDTVAESFRQMPSPVVNRARLLEVDGMLGMFTYRNSDPVMNIGIWVLQDYQGAVWAFKGQGEFRAEIIAQFGIYRCWEIATSCNGDVLVLLRFDDWLLQADIDGKLVANFPGKCLSPTKFRLKQTLVPHIFFPAP